VSVRSAVTGSDSSRVYSASTPKYHAADKDDTPLSNINRNRHPGYFHAEGKDIVTYS